MEQPEWTFYCHGIKRFTAHEATSMLCGLNPMSDYLPSEFQHEYMAINAAIHHAIEDGDLIATGKKGRGNQDTFNREDLRAWAKSVGYGWPLPPLQNQQSTPVPDADSALLEKVQQLEAQNADLVQQVAALELDLDRVKNAARKRIAELNEQLQHASVTPEERRWPWGNHTTPELEILREIAPLFWADGKIEDETDVPTNEEFAAKLIEHDLPKHKANSLASMFRPSDMPTGRRRKG